MISAQIDKMRKYANKVDGTFPMLANALRDAADTILSLRDMAQDLRAENALLRSELDSVGTAAYLYGRSDLKAENAKLRELMADMHRYGLCECEHKDDCQTCEFAFPRRMQELGLEWGELQCLRASRLTRR